MNTATKLLTRDELKPGVNYIPVGPDGQELSGTLEIVRGVADINHVKIDDDDPKGEVDIEYGGETKIWWDEQRTERSEDGIEDRIWVDTEGNEHFERELKFKEEET